MRLRRRNRGRSIMQSRVALHGRGCTVAGGAPSTRKVRNMSTHRSTILGLLALGFLAARAAPAAAADRFGVIGLTNRTNITVNFRYKVGDGPWVNKRIAPGEKLWFSHRYTRINEDRSPTFYIRFDSDLRFGKDFRTEYKLQRRAAVGQSYEYGKKYAFEYERGDRNFIDLKSID